MVMQMSSFDDFIQLQRRMNIIYNSVQQAVDMSALIEVSNALAKPMADIAVLQAPYIAQETLANFSRSIRASMNVDYLQNINISDSMREIVKSVQPNIELVNANLSLFMQNYSDMISDLNSIGYHLSELIQQACDEIDDEEVIEDDFSSSEEIVETLQEQADNQKGFQERVADWSEAKKKKYYIIIGMIYFVWANFCQPYFQDTVGKPVTAYVVSKVKELPQTAGKVIDELKEDLQAIITEDVPYYYKVTYTDEEGNVREGYVAKRNLKVIEVEETAEEDEENEE